VAAKAQTVARTFVLVHGAWHGGWCWSRVADRLRAAGHRVFTPTQTGLGERKHLLSKDITLDTFTKDIVNVIEAEELSSVILVRRSFGGLAISGVADAMPDTDWVKRRLTPHPLNTYTSPLNIKGPIGNSLPRTYIACTNPTYAALEGSRKWVKAQQG
jgi:pimeloyl-ACP methyl ester carboxylesterase